MNLDMRHIIYKFPEISLMYDKSRSSNNEPLTEDETNPWKCPKQTHEGKMPYI